MERLTRKKLLIAFGLAYLLPAFAIAAESDNDPVEYSVQGRYNNPVYGFSVIVPDHLTAYGDAPPRPNHGIGIPLGDKRMIYVNAEFNALEYESAKAAVQGDAEYDHAPNVATKTAKLGKYKAVAADYTGDGDAHKLIELILTDGSEIIYSVHLVTDKAHLAEDGKVFDQVVASFRKTKRE